MSKEVCKMAAQSLDERTVTSIEKSFGLSELKIFHKDVLYNVGVKKRDCLVCVPTGSGKSLCYEALPLVLEAGKTTADQQEPVIILISPLVNLINMQVESLNAAGFSAVSVVRNLDHETKQNLENCSYRGLSTDSKPAFRSFFSKVGDLRAKLPDAPILCLTATASKSTLSSVKQLLAMRDPFEFVKSPDRPNIRLYVKKVKKEGAMEWLVEGGKKNGGQYKKTIVYCRSIRECAELYGFFEEKLGKNTLQLEKRNFDMIHSKTMLEIKTGIIRRFTEEDGQLVVVFATKILGMGLDIQCPQIVHYGPPGSVDDFIQQIGRAGRDGAQAHAILLFHGSQLRNIDPTMRKIVKSGGSCLREILLQDFGGERSCFCAKHLCCNACALECTCGRCKEDLNQFEQYLQGNEEFDMEDDDEEREDTREVSESQRNQLRVALVELKSELDREVMCERPIQTPPFVFHGLDYAVLNDILDKANTIYSVDDLINKCTISQYGTACQILVVLSTVFCDVDMDICDHQDEVVIPL